MFKQRLKLMRKIVVQRDKTQRWEKTNLKSNRFCPTAGGRQAVPNCAGHPAQAAVLRSAGKEVPDSPPDRGGHHPGHEVWEAVQDKRVHRLRHCHRHRRWERSGQGVHCRRREAVLNRLAEQVRQGVQVHADSRNRVVIKIFKSGHSIFVT